MPDQNIGAISVGITADLRQLEADLRRAKQDIGSWQPPSKTISIRVGEPSFTAFDRKINDAIRQAEQRKINLAPTISVADASIANFRNEIQTKMANHPVLVPVTADIDETVFQQAIQTAIGGPYSVPLTWHWVDGPPPGDLEGGSAPVKPTGGGTGGGTAGGGGKQTGGKQTGGTPTGGTPTGGTPTGTAGPKPTETVVTTPPVNTTQAKCGTCGEMMAISAVTRHQYNKHFSPAQKAAYDATHKAQEQAAKDAQQAPAEPTQAQPTAGPTAAGPTATTPPVSPLISRQQQPPTEAARRKNFFGEIAGELRQGGIVGRQAFDRLMKAGAVIGGDIGDEGFGLIRGKRGSDVAKFLKDQKDLDTALQAFNQVLGEFASNLDEEGRTGLERGIGGRARSLAGKMPGPAIDLGGVGRDEPGTPVRGQAQAKADLVKRLLGEVSADRLANQRKYATDPQVVAIRAAFEGAGAAEAAAAELAGRPVDPNAALGAIHGVTTPTLGEAGVTGTEGREMSFTQPGTGANELPNLAEIREHIKNDEIAEARAKLVTGVGQVFTALPKVAGKFFPSNTRALRGVGYDEAAAKYPGLEAWAAGATALFGEIERVNKPREDIHTKEARANASTRRDVRRTAAGDVIPEGESIELGARPETRASQTAGQAQIIEMVRNGVDPTDAAQRYFASIGGLPEKFDAYFSALDQVAIKAAQEAFQNEGIPPVPTRRSRSGTPQTAPRGRAPVQTQKFGDVVRGFEMAQVLDLGPAEAKNPRFSFKQAGPIGESSPFMTVDQAQKVAEKEFLASQQRQVDEAARATAGPVSKAAALEAKKAEEAAKQKAKDEALKAIRAKGKQTGGYVEGDPIGSMLRSFPGAMIDFPERPFADQDPLELLAEESERFAHDFPATAQRIVGVREGRLPRKHMGVTKAAVYDEPKGLTDYLRKVSRAGMFDITIGDEYMTEMPNRPTGTSADYLGLRGVLSHELGHATDAANKSVLSAYAASESSATKYGGAEKAGDITPSENAAELFAMRGLPKGVKPQAPAFYEMLEKLSAFERQRMGRAVGGGTRAWTAASMEAENAYHAEQMAKAKARRATFGSSTEFLDDLKRREAEAEARDPGSVLGGGHYGRWKKLAGEFNIPANEWEPEYHRYYGEDSTEEIRAKAPSGPSLGRIEGEKDVDTLVDKLKRMAEQTDQSPQEAMAARMHLRRKGIEGYQTGGGGLMARLAAAKAKNEYLLGEKRPEKFRDDRGNEEIVGLHGPEIRGFSRPGKIIPTVPQAELLEARKPEWLRRASAKDLTRREAGGPTVQTPEEFEATNPPITFTAEQYAHQQRLRDILNPPPEPEPAPLYKKSRPTKFTGQFAAEPGSGLRGGKQIRDPFAGEQEAVAQGKLSPTGGVQRVFVVNWPPALSGAATGKPGTGPGPAFQNPAEAQAAGPFGAGIDMDAFAKKLGASIASAMPKQARAKRAAAGAGTKAAGGAEDEEAPEPVQIRRETAVERVTRQMAIADQALEREADLKRISAIRSGAVSLLAQRGVQTAGGEILSTAAGGRQPAIERARQSELLQAGAKARSTMLNQEANTLAKLTDEYARMEEAGASPEELAKQTAAIEDQVQAFDKVGESYVTTRDKAASAAKGITSLGGVLRNFSTNLGGIIAGTFIFSGALGAAQLGLTALTEVVAPVVERLAGYANLSARVTSTLADQSKAAGGATEATVALALANTNLSAGAAATIAPFLEQRVSVEAGNKSLQEGIDLFNAAQAVRQQNAGRDMDQGITRTTGGQFGSIIGGIPSTSELVGNFLRDVSTIPSAGNEAEIAEKQARLDQIITEQAAKGREEYEISGLPGIEIRRLKLDLENLGGVVGDSEDRFTFLNKSIEAGTAAGKELFTFAAQAKRPVSEEDRAAQVAAAEEIGAFDVANNIRDLKSVILDAQGNVVTDPDQVAAALQAANVGLQTPDPALLLQTLQERVIPAQLGGIEAEGELQLNKLIPAQQALDFLANPPTPFGAGIVPGAGMVGPTGATPFGGPAPTAGFGPEAPGVDPTATASFNEYQAVATQALDAVAAKAREGQQALREMGVPPALITEMTELGATAQSIELDIADRQATFGAAQYNRQLFQMNRNLADARALLGQNAGAQGRLGALQRQNFEIGKQQHALQIQAQTLALDLQQRQINFSRAIAGFTAPGITPEERQARVKEAKIEADFAQKQLDIQRKLLGLGKRQFNIDVNIFNESARRQVQDLELALAELKQSHELEIRTKAAQQALTAVRAREAQITRDIGVAIEKATKRAALAINSAIEITQKTGEAFSTILGQTAKAWNTFLIQADRAIDGVTNPNNTGGAGGAGGGRRPSADGLLGSFNTPTPLLVGEAGSETVAVLRNVRQHVIQPGGGGGGGGGMIVVDVHDNTLATKEDEQKFVNMIIQAVDKAQGRKIAIMGGRAY